MDTQKILKASPEYRELTDWTVKNGIRKILLVCDDAFRYLKIASFLENEDKHPGFEIVRFSDFQPNPLYESVVKGVRLFSETGCEAILAVGGGSALDVAKCIKLYQGLNPEINYLQQRPMPNTIPMMAVPTTAGTGSEATRYAVIYFDGEKQSISDTSIIPDTVLMDASSLKTLPAYQKKSTMLDAFCHAIESFWSVNSTEESMKHSANAIRGILSNRTGYLKNDDASNEGMLYAANEAGQAINITQTTAAHAMCYKLTSVYGIAHGHAAALCLKELFPWMIRNTDLCIDPRGERHLGLVFRKIAEAMDCGSTEDAALLFERIFLETGLETPKAAEEDISLLASSVNPVRLKNHPVRLDRDTIDRLYHKILRCE
ncbi:MAG: phosphonoacetaldehyde reductase [Lachnospiraceae bacterium]|nr:phosphonoacetaldehyde reductase [Lachnospiraceae bacterium]